MTQDLAATGLARTAPDGDASAAQWVGWFWHDFLPGWTQHVQTPGSIGFHDALDKTAAPVQPDRRTVLAQARLLFTFAHLALQSDNPVYHDAAAAARKAVVAFRKAPGLYCRARTASGAPTGQPGDELATSYDQSFVILGLATWGRLHPEYDVSGELDAYWAAVETTLTDPVTGLMLEHDGAFDPADPSAPKRAQNPHMHLYEACLQAFEMTQAPIWLTRAADMRAMGLKHFFDADTGTITEFLAPDLSVLPGRDGQWREIGHQCEWAWLLLREVELGGDPGSRAVALRLLNFADQHGFSTDGPMAGAAFDAVSADLTWREEKFLLWPQTEAIKAHAVRADTGDHADRAGALVVLIFRQYFAGRAAFVNQLDATGAVIWDEALSRLHYHLVLALTEGARAGLWPGPSNAG